MIITILLAILFSKYKHLNIQPIFKCMWLLPIAILEAIHLIFQICIMNKIYIFIPYAELLKRVYLYALFFPILRYRLYRPALTGSWCIILGTLLNRMVMTANGGQMPIYPSISKLTGYFSMSPLFGYDSIHYLGNSQSKLKYLSDYIDLGFCILSPGDLLIHFFTFLILYNTIKKLNQKVVYITEDEQYYKQMKGN